MIWKPIDGYSGAYDIREDGLIRRNPISYNGLAGGIEIKKSKNNVYYPKIRINRKGYKIVSLYIAGEGRAIDIAVHRLVAMTFINGYQDGLTVDHLDCDKLNNHYTNLEWVTNKENLLRSHRYGTHSKFIPKLKRRKLKSEDVIRIRSLYTGNLNEKFSQRKLAKMFSVSQDTIKKVINNVGTYATASV